jgi:hypothetical protein
MGGGGPPVAGDPRRACRPLWQRQRQGAARCSPKKPPQLRPRTRHPPSPPSPRQFNEPWVTCNLQWGNGDFAPGVKEGEAGKWKCGHNLLLSHATAVKTYRDNYQKDQGGKIGMALWSEWSEPFRDTFEGGNSAAGRAGRMWRGQGGNVRAWAAVAEVLAATGDGFPAGTTDCQVCSLPPHQLPPWRPHRHRTTHRIPQTAAPPRTRWTWTLVSGRPAGASLSPSAALACMPLPRAPRARYSAPERRPLPLPPRMSWRTALHPLPPAQPGAPPPPSQGWFADTINFGDYPDLVKRRYSQHLPVFSDAEKQLLKKSYDYMGLTLYTAKYALRDPQREDGWWVATKDVNGNVVGEQAESCARGRGAGTIGAAGASLCEWAPSH